MVLTFESLGEILKYSPMVQFIQMLCNVVLAFEWYTRNPKVSTGGSRDEGWDFNILKYFLFTLSAPLYTKLCIYQCAVQGLFLHFLIETYKVTFLVVVNLRYVRHAEFLKFKQSFIINILVLNIA